MDRYMIYCTEYQTKKALELGAPIIELDNEVALEDRSRIGFGLPSFGSFDDYLNKNEYPDIAVIDIDDVKYAYYQPTAEQMIGWLEGQGFFDEIDVYRYENNWFWELWLPHRYIKKNIKYSSRKEATIAAIDAALDYLVNNSIK